MAFYWSLKSVPELALAPPWVRKAIWMQREQSSWWSLPGIAITAFFMTASIFNQDVFPAHPQLVAIAEYALFIIAITHFQIARSLSSLRRWVGGVCPTCGYDLRASEGRCPECGDPVDRGLSCEAKLFLLKGDLASRLAPPSRIELMFFPLPTARAAILRDTLLPKSAKPVVSEANAMGTWLKSTHVTPRTTEERSAFSNWILEMTNAQDCRLATFRILS